MTTTTTDNGALRSADNWATLVATITGGTMPDPTDDYGTTEDGRAYSPDCMQTPECPELCATTIPAENNHAPLCAHRLPDFGFAWCPDCRGRQRVMDVDDVEHQDRLHRYQARAQMLECGHNLEGPSRVVAAADGAGYAPSRAEVLGRQAEVTW